MKWLDHIISLFLVALSLVILFSSVQLGLGTLRKPGAGFIPFLASVLVFCLSMVVLMMGMKRRPHEEKRSWVGWQNFGKMVILVMGLCVYISILKAIGYLIAASFLMFLMFFIFDPKKWYVHILSALLVSGVSFVIFRGLGVQLPTGIFSIGW
ncbi:MAG: hypothetical protein A2170_11325 [Deltaproteobacteria bacterium RBG_13_53_10]|nr:MAG: hypothetical protein A2170_11325 [Deltaproteobacteria bacterium RBG_13_53_10]